MWDPDALWPPEHVALPARYDAGALVPGSRMPFLMNLWEGAPAQGDRERGVVHGIMVTRRVAQ